MEPVLAGFGAEFFFDRVLIQPGQPLVFGQRRGKFFFGLPGNPASTMVTFEIFARAALELLGGEDATALHMPLRAPDSRVPPPARPDALSAGAPERRRQRGDAGGVARVGRHSVADARQRLPGGRPGPPRIRARRTGYGCCRNEETLALRFRRQRPHGGRLGQSRDTQRTARAHAFVRIAPAVLRRSCRENPKGNPLEIARIAGIAAAKRTAELIPLCHPLMLSHADVEVTVGDRRACASSPRATTTAQTGVEMEALTAAAVAALTVYDMTKALDKAIEIQDVYLLEKTGGKSGDYRRKGSMTNAAVLTISDSVSAGTRGGPVRTGGA